MAPVRTLYIRNVPDEVAERLERLAARHRVSVNALVVRELDATARRADNAALLSDLPDDADIGMDEIVESIREARGER
jgi:plasmid stability protein